MAIKTQPYTVEHIDSVVGGLHGLKAEFENKHLTELFAEDPAIRKILCAFRAGGF